MKLAVIGFMGSGKSTVGALLAARLALPLVEMDFEIVRLSGRSSVREIFERDGEAAFRRMEREVAKSLAGRSDVVISTGGGAVSDADAMRALKDNGGVIVYLETSFDTVLERVGSGSERPLLANVESARELHAQREPRYRAAADLSIETDGRTPDEICGEIVRRLRYA
jgi:shikimate kinase